MPFSRLLKHALMLGSIVSLLATASAQASQTLTFSSPAAKASACRLMANRQLLDYVATEGATSVTLTAHINHSAPRGKYRIVFICEPYKPVVKTIHIHSHLIRGIAGFPLINLYLSRIKPAPKPAPAIPSPPSTPAPTASSPTVFSPFACPLSAPCPDLPTVVQPVLSPKALTLASKIWLAWEPQFTEEAFHDGQCVELADNKRPDIVARVMEDAIAERIMAGDTNPYPNPIPNFDAQMWDSNAAAAGIEVGATPKEGAIMVFHDQLYNHLTAPGHVAYVDSVNADGSVTITEEHAPELWEVRTETISAQYLVGKNIDYIY